MKAEELKIGMEVILNEEARYCSYGYTSPMEKYIGKKVIISKKKYDIRKNKFSFTIKGDPAELLYDAACFSPCQVAKIYRWIDGIEYELTPTGRGGKSLEDLLYIAEMLVEKDAIVDRIAMYPKVAVATARVNGVTKVGIAKCSPEDNYEEDIGFALAVFRALDMKEEEEQLLSLI